MTSGDTALKVDDVPVVVGGNACDAPSEGILKHLRSFKHRLIVFCFVVHNSPSG